MLKQEDMKGVMALVAKIGWIILNDLDETIAQRVAFTYTRTNVGNQRFHELYILLSGLDEAEGKIRRGETYLFSEADVRNGQINPNEMACICLLSRSYTTAHIYPEMPRAVKILDEAGWTRVGESTYSESTYEANVSVTPTLAGDEKFKSLRSLLNELDNAGHKLSHDEAAFVWKLARRSATDNPDSLRSFTL